MTGEFLLLLHAAATLPMVGLIWFVQVVHYPLFGQVGAERFTRYEQDHQRRTTRVVAPLMLVEAATAALLVAFTPAGVSSLLPITGLALVVMLWLSTFLWQVPLHTRLQSAFQPSAHTWLVRSNWLRTFGWTARGVLVCWMLGQIYLLARFGDVVLQARLP